MPQDCSFSLQFLSACSSRGLKPRLACQEVSLQKTTRVILITLLFGQAIVIQLPAQTSATTRTSSTTVSSNPPQPPKGGGNNPPPSGSKPSGPPPSGPPPSGTPPT